MMVTAMYEPGACLVCGDPTTRPDGTCCSQECSSVWNPYRRWRNTLPGRVATCGFCGEMFEAKRRDRLDFCTRDCAFAYKATRQHELWRRVFEGDTGSRVCVVCFRRGPTRVCRSGCVELGFRFYNWTRRAERWRQVTCRECGDEFSDENQGRPREYCDDCREVAAKRVARRHRRVRRARKRGVRSEAIDLRDIAVRDGWSCGLCGGRVLRTKQVPHPRAATLDHIVPLARGGDHVRRNVQLAHFRCNSEKGDRAVGSQLRILG